MAEDPEPGTGDKKNLDRKPFLVLGLRKSSVLHWDFRLCEKSSSQWTLRKTLKRDP